MEPDTSVPPPEAVLIRRARAAAHLTVEAAAEAVRSAGGKISASYWGDVERGQGGRRGARVSVQASPQILAHMARAVGLTPERLRAAGRANASEAAEILDEMTRGPVTAEPSALPLDDVDEGELRPYLQGVLDEIAAAIARHGPSPSGAQVFGNAQDIEIWDNSPWPRGERARAIAVLRMLVDEALHPGERRAMLPRTTVQYVTKRLQRVILLLLSLVSSHTQGRHCRSTPGGEPGIQGQPAGPR